MLPELRPEAQDLIARVKDFIEQDCIPSEHIFHDQIEEGENRWNSYPEVINELKDKAKSKGLWNLFLPESEFGAGLTNYEYAHLAEVMGTCHIASEAMNCAAPDTGNMEVIARYGNETHQKEWLQPLLDGEIRSAFAMTEPGVGSSDATNMQATAVLDGDEYVINGEKWYVTSANKADFFFLQAKLKNGKNKDQHALFIVDKHLEGIELIDTPEFTHTFSHHHCIYNFNDVKIPSNCIIGKEDDGMAYTHSWFRHERLGIAARCCGAAERLIFEATKFAKDREANGSKIKDFQLIQSMLADSVTELAATRVLLFEICKEHDNQTDVKILHAKCSMIKLYASEMANRVADRAVQIFGGRGYMRENVAERFFRELRADRIWEGTSEIQRIIIANSLYKRGLENLI